MKLLARIVHRYSAWVLVGTLAITAAMAPGMFIIKTKEGAGPESNFTSPNEMVKAIFDVKKSFGENTRMTAISVEAKGSRSITERQTLELIQKLSKDFKNTPGIKKDSILSLSNMVEVRNTKDGLESEPLMKKLPQNFDEEQAFQEKVRHNELIFGRLVTKDFKTALIVGTVANGTGLYALHTDLAKLVKPYQEMYGDIEVNIAGTPEVDYQLDSNIKRETTVFMLVAMGLLICAFLFIFRTWKGVVIPFSTTGLAIIWTMGAMGYYGHPIDILSSLLPVLLVVTGSSYSIHIFHLLDEKVKDGHNFFKCYYRILKRIASPLMMSASTTFVGSIALLSFKVEMIQHFGLFGAFGTLVTAFMALIVIPAFYNVLRSPIRKAENAVEHGVLAARDLAEKSVHAIPVAGAMAEGLQAGVQGGIKGFIKGFKSANLVDRFMRGLAHLVNKRPWTVIAVALMLFTGAAFEARKVVISFDNLSMLPKGFKIKDVTEHLNKAFNGIQSFDVVIDTQKPDGATDPKFLKRLEEMQKSFIQNPHISHAFSVVDVLRKVDSVMNSTDKVAAVGKLPEKRDSVAQYLLLLSMGGGGALSLDSLVTPDHQKVKIALTTNVNETQGFGQLYEELREDAYRTLGSEVKVEFGGNPMVWIALMKVILWGKVQNALLSLLLILVIISMVYKSIVRGMVTILTLPFGIFMNFGIMGHYGIRLDIVTAIITSFAMGIGVDFAVHFISAVKDEYAKHKDIEKAIQGAIAGPGKAIMYNALSTKVGFSALLFSKFAPLNTFAILMCTSMSILAIGALTVLPAVIRVMKPEFITGYREKHHVEERNLDWMMKWGLSGAVCALLIAGIIFTENKANASDERPVDQIVVIEKSK